MKAENFCGVKNQFVIYTKKAIVFQSYETPIAVYVRESGNMFVREDNYYMNENNAYSSREIVALACAANGIVVNTDSVQVSLRKEAGVILYEKMKIEKEKYEVRSVYDTVKESGDVILKHGKEVIEWKDLNKESFIKLVDGFGLNFYNVK